MRWVVRVKTISQTESQVQFVLYMDPGGDIPSYFVRKTIPSALLILDDLRSVFQDDSNIDKRNHKRFATIIRSNKEEYTPEEIEDFDTFVTLDTAPRRGMKRATGDRNIKKVQLYKLEGLKDEDFVEMDSISHLVWVGIWDAKAQDDKSHVGRAITVVDASIEDIAAWEMTKMSREILTVLSAAHDRGYQEFDRKFMKVNEHNYLYYLLVQVNVPGVLPREILVNILWKWLDADTLVVVYNDAEHDDFPKVAGHVRSSIKSICKYERLPPLNNIPQTRLTFTLQANPEGTIGMLPDGYLKAMTVSQLEYLVLARQRFDKSIAVDKFARDITASKLSINQRRVYTEDEDGVIKEGAEMLKAFDQDKKKTKVKTGSATVLFNEIAHKAGDRIGWGGSEFVVRAKKKSVLSYMWNMNSRCRWEDTDLERNVLEVVNDHHLVTYQCMRSAKGHKHHGFGGVHPRELVTRTVWKKLDDGAVLCVSVPTDHKTKGQEQSRQINGRRKNHAILAPNRASNRGDARGNGSQRLSGVRGRYKVRAKMTIVFKIKDTITPGISKVTYVRERSERLRRQRGGARAKRAYLIYEPHYMCELRGDGVNKWRRRGLVHCCRCCSVCGRVLLIRSGPAKQSVVASWRRGLVHCRRLCSHMCVGLALAAPPSPLFYSHSRTLRSQVHYSL